MNVSVQTPNGCRKTSVSVCTNAEKHNITQKRNAKMYAKITEIPAGYTADNSNYFFDNGELFVYCEK